MRNTILSILVAVLASLNLVVGLGVCNAETAVTEQKAALPEQKVKEGVYVWAKSDITKLEAGDKLKQYQDAETTLVGEIKKALTAHELLVGLAESEKDMVADQTRYLLIVALEKVELGFRGPVAQINTLRVSYRFQNKQRAEIMSRSYEEKSFSNLKSNIRKASETIATDVALAIDDISKGKNPADRAAQVKAGTGPSTETRLQQLESLKEKGLITQEEYGAKRKEILKEL